MQARASTLELCFRCQVMMYILIKIQDNFERYGNVEFMHARNLE